MVPHRPRQKPVRVATGLRCSFEVLFLFAGIIILNKGVEIWRGHFQKNPPGFSDALPSNRSPASNTSAFMMGLDDPADEKSKRAGAKPRDNLHRDKDHSSRRKLHPKFARLSHPADPSPHPVSPLSEPTGKSSGMQVHDGLKGVQVQPKWLRRKPFPPTQGGSNSLTSPRVFRALRQLCHWSNRPQAPSRPCQ